jgi:hypothetical protein
VTECTNRSICWVALVTLMKTELLIWRSRSNCKIFRGLGAISLILIGWVDADEGDQFRLLESNSTHQQASGLEETDSPSDPDNEVDLGLGGDVEVTGSPGLSSEPDLLLLPLGVLLDVLVGPLEDDLPLGSVGLQIPPHMRQSVDKT